MNRESFCTDVKSWMKLNLFNVGPNGDLDSAVNELYDSMYHENLAVIFSKTIEKDATDKFGDHFRYHNRGDEHMILVHSSEVYLNLDFQIFVRSSLIDAVNRGYLNFTIVYSDERYED